eukprot:423419_1
MGLTTFFNWKVALIWHTIFFSGAMLPELPILGMLWFVINTFVFLLLLRAVYGPVDDKSANRGMAWYFYILSVFTDFISLCIYGQHIINQTAFLAVFVLVMAIFILIPKPLFAYYLLKSLRAEGFDVKKGLNLRKSTVVSSGAQYQGLTESLDQQIAETENQGYKPQQQQQQQQQQQHQTASDIVIVPNQQQPSNDINESLMDNVGQHDVFAPGQ